jgi:ABC-type dipeptide/oligopeptide/nickel transport system ATPase component
MYGRGRLCLPKHFQKHFQSKVKAIAAKTSSGKSQVTSRFLLQKLDKVQRTIEYSMYHRDGPLMSTPNAKMVDVQGNLMLLVVQDHIYTVADITKNKTPMFPIHKRYTNSSLTFCSNDKVVVETIG